MIEEMDLTSVNIPYGVLHDQNLKNIEYNNNIMTFTFEIELSQMKDLLTVSNYIQFLTCLTNGYSLQIQFATGFYDVKGKYKKYRNYSGLDLNVSAEKIFWKWY